MNLTEEFLRQHGIQVNDPQDLEYETDNTYYVYVDGEEGDHGTVGYLIDGVVVAYQTILGGDDEQVDFTSEGTDIFREWAKECLLKLLTTA